MSAATSSSQFDLQDLLGVVRRRKWVIIPAVIVTTLIAVGSAMLTTPKYASTASILIQQQGSSVRIGASNSPNLSPELATEVELQLIRSQRVREKVREMLGYGASVSVAAANKGVVANIRAVSPDAGRAAEVANAYANAYLEVRRQSAVDDYLATAQALQDKVGALDAQITEIDDQLRQLSGETASEAAEAGVLRVQQEALVEQRSNLKESLDAIQVNAEIARAGGPRIIATASPASKPFDPNLVRSLTTGLLVGLLIGVAAAFLLDYLDDTVKTKSELEAAAGGLTVLAVIPRMTEWRNRREAHLVSIEEPTSPLAEAYRSLRTSVQFVSLDRSIRTVQITSPRSQDGKSTTATNLAVALARAGQRVILIDCDLRRPRVHDFFGLSNSLGFTSVLVGDVPLVEAIQAVPNLDRLRVLASGPQPPDPSELLSSRRAHELVKAISEACDVVIIDTPPVLPVADALVVSEMVDACILVALVGSTTRQEVQRAVELLEQVDAPLIGMVMNGGTVEKGYGYGAPDQARSRWSTRRPNTTADSPGQSPTIRSRPSRVADPTPAPTDPQPSVSGGAAGS